MLSRGDFLWPSRDRVNNEMKLLLLWCLALPVLLLLGKCLVPQGQISLVTAIF